MIENIISIIILSLLCVIVIPPLTFLRKHEKNEKFALEKWSKRCLYTFIISVIIISIIFVLDNFQLL